MQPGMPRKSARVLAVFKIAAKFAYPERGTAAAENEKEETK